MKTVIASVDFSPVTNRIVDAAIKLARSLKGRVVLLHVVAPPAAIRDVLPAIEDVALHAMSSRNEADRKLGELKHSVQRRFPGIDLVRLSGSPVTCIVEEARRRTADYVVIGSHGHSAVYDALIGSVAMGVMKKAPCPVVVVPPISAQA